MSPDRRIVEAIIEDVRRSSVMRVLENVAVFAVRLDRVRLPFAFVIAVYPRTMAEALLAVIVL
jgi:hypothetical protein